MKFRRSLPDIVISSQIEALNKTLYIVRNLGPTGFMLQDDNHTVRTFLGEKHSCSCAKFTKHKDLCCHICWLLLRKFKLDKDEPNYFQLGLDARTIESVIRGERLASSKAEVETISVDTDTPVKTIKQRQIEDEDICPVCQDSFYGQQRSLVTFCRSSCGNSVHAKCLRIWMEHQLKTANGTKLTSISCPVCRGNFGEVQQLREELSVVAKLNKKSAQNNPTNDHLHILSSNAVKNSKLEEKFVGLVRSSALPATGKEFNSLGLCRMELRKNSRILKFGHQCCICLMHFEERDRIIKVPHCYHAFHHFCLTPWITKISACCPLDGNAFVKPELVEKTDSPILVIGKSRMSKKTPEAKLLSKSQRFNPSYSSDLSNQISDIHLSLTIKSLSEK